jgi:hypothetical protein
MWVKHIDDGCCRFRNDRMIALSKEQRVELLLKVAHAAGYARRIKCLEDNQAIWHIRGTSYDRASQQLVEQWVNDGEGNVHQIIGCLCHAEGGAK